ncbi:periphilin-1-like isoform X2 [Electrophorus electricus]|nr:periphilin-1-like isoform X2 [Electrophorus electricus]
MDRRPAFSCTEDDCERGSGYDHSQSGGGYHGDNQGGYHGERALYSGERSGPLYRREDPYSYRESAGQRSAARQAELRNSARVTSQTNIKGQRLPPPWSLSISVCHRGDDCVSRTITSTGRREECEALKRKVSFPPVREHSPVKREVPHSPQNRSSRSFTPDSGKASHPYPSQPKKSPFPQVSQEKEKVPSYCFGGSQDESPHILLSAAKDRMPGFEVEQGEETKKKEDPGQSPEARRAHAIANKALEIEKLYRQDCETFGTVVKMLLAKQPTLETLLQTALKENLIDIKQRCLEDLRRFISEVDAVLKANQSSAAGQIYSKDFFHPSVEKDKLNMLDFRGYQ